MANTKAHRRFQFAERKRSLVRWGGVAAAMATGAYAAYIAQACWRYGHPSPPRPEEVDALLDRFLVYGQTTTSLIQSSPVPQRSLPLPGEGNA